MPLRESVSRADGLASAHQRTSERSPESERVDRLLREVARPSIPARSLPGRLVLPRIGSSIAEKYRVVRRIGAGGMGVVFEAVHVVSGKAVAIKWMPHDDAGVPARLLSEARAIARIEHPSIVDVYDVISDDSGAYLVMELLKGETLAERLSRGPLSEDELLDLVLPVLSGVEAAHRRGVIHRDLKPENLFLCAPVAPDGRVRPKVLDFGISKIVAATSGGASRLTRDGALLGTPAFMSPEQLRDPRQVDARSDIYSLGVVMFEALTGRLPFDASGRDALVIAIAEQRARSIREVMPSVSRRLAVVVTRAMAPDPDNRFPNARALIEALEAVRSDAPAVSSRRAVLATVGTASFVAALVAIRDEPPPAEPAPRWAPAPVEIVAHQPSPASSIAQPEPAHAAPGRVEVAAPSPPSSAVSTRLPAAPRAAGAARTGKPKGSRAPDVVARAGALRVEDL